MRLTEASVVIAWDKVCGKAVVALLAAASLYATPQNPPALQISSPITGSTINPGQTLSVTVTSPAGLAFQMVAVIGPDPIGFNTSGTSMPAQFSIAIPPDADCHVYSLSADGLTQAGQSVTSAPIQIDVERPDLPTSLSATDSGVSLETQGGQSHLRILASFLDGSQIDVTQSTLISYASSNPGTATVDSSGTVTAVAAGSSTLTVTYTLGSQSIQISIPVTVQLPMLGTAPSSLTFAAQNIGTSSSPQVITFTNMAAGAVTVLNISATGDFSETDNCTSSSPLSAGVSCIVSVSFSPTTAGTRPGTIAVSNSANTAPVLVALTGSGTAVPPTTPAITNLSPSSGAAGTAVTITGTNFGGSQGTSTVAFNGTPTTPTSWGANSIVGPVPSGATTGNVVVTVGGAASNGVNFTVQGTTSGIALVQHTSLDVAVSTSSSVAFASNNAAGNWIGVCVRAGSSGETITVTDTLGNTYHQAVQIDDTLDTPTGNTLAIFYAENISAGANTVTVSDTVSGTLRFAILEYTGVATANSLDVTVMAQGNGKSPSSGSATTTASGDLLLGAIATADVDSFSATHSFQTREFVPAEPNTKLIAEDQIQTAAGSASATASLQTSDPWGAVFAAFKAARSN